MAARVRHESSLRPVGGGWTASATAALAYKSKIKIFSPNYLLFINCKLLGTTVFTDIAFCPASILLAYDLTRSPIWN